MALIELIAEDIDAYLVSAPAQVAAPLHHLRHRSTTARAPSSVGSCTIQQDDLRGSARRAGGQDSEGHRHPEAASSTSHCCMDGLAAEREQGITIDVAYRFFSTERRKFIVADTPGHEQYTRNMVTGASTANLAVILMVDARHGVLHPDQAVTASSPRCSASSHVVVAVNKMDLVDWSREALRGDQKRVSTTFVAAASVIDRPDTSSPCPRSRATTSWPPARTCTGTTVRP